MSLSQEAAADATTGYARDTVLTASQQNGSNFGCNRVINVILIFLFIAAIAHGLASHMYRFDVA